MRKSGIVMHISSLPSPYGIGTLGKAAYDFADFLSEAGQSFWQMLPLGPTSYGDSPYQSFSSFAGNPYFIDLELLAREGLLTKQELDEADMGRDPSRVDYAAIYTERFRLLRKAYSRSPEASYRGFPEEGGPGMPSAEPSPDAVSCSAYESFLRENRRWLDPYTEYMALKKFNGMKAWQTWSLHREDILADELAREKNFHAYLQYLFFKQWDKLKAYVNSKGISIIGDMPIYVAPDSADVWSEPEFFMLDEDGSQKLSAGVPPDYFSEDGQFWGNPVYNYDAMKKDGYGWWIRRVAGAARLYDVIRIDHFRGFESYWGIPKGETTAKNGAWIKGPGMDLVGTLTGWFNDTKFIAEDLGILTTEVHELLKASGLPGMKVLEFAFDDTHKSAYLPHNCTENSVCYTGTHDNAVLYEWIEDASEEETAFIREYLGMPAETDGKPDKEKIALAVIRAGLGTRSSLFMARMQDWLNAGRECRMNVPGRPDGNWQWRMLPGQADKDLAGRIRHMTEMYGRC